MQSGTYLIGQKLLKYPVWNYALTVNIMNGEYRFNILENSCDA